MLRKCTAPAHLSGRSSGYLVHGCRCEACTAANTAKQRDYLRRNPHQMIYKRAYMRGYRAGQRAARREAAS